MNAELPTPCLSEEQIGRFHGEGYLALELVTTAEEVTRLASSYDRLFAERVGYDQGDYFDFAGVDDRAPVLPQLHRPSVYDAAFKESLLFRNCAAMAAQLLGPEAEFVFDHAMLKPPGAPPTPWHQDQAFWSKGMRHRTITFWVPFQDVDPASGCLKFLPKSQRDGLYPHRPLDNRRHTHGLEATDVPERSVVYCPLSAGGATVHHWLVLHGADRNVTRASRRAYAIGFGVAGAEPVVDREYSWNRIRRTERERRYLASLTPWRRLKREIRIRMLRRGL